VAGEAAAVGTAGVVSDRCGIAAAFEPGEALVVPYDVDATVGAIGQVLQDAALRGQLEQGALRAAARSTWDAVVEQQLALYAEALAG
jgi:glycosyltransferase involved in cell wall biosynthesis